MRWHAQQQRPLTMDGFMTLKGKNLWIACLLFLALSGIPTFILWKEVKRIAKMERHVVRRQNTDTRTLGDISFTLNQVISSLGKTSILLPSKLSRVICAQQIGIIKEVRTVEIDPIFAPYNPSIVEKEDGGYHLFFRYDIAKELWHPQVFQSNIGYAELDDNFKPIKVVEKINTKSSSSEDPRIVKVGKDFFLSWNDLLDEKKGCRSIHIGKWNPQNCQLEYITNLDQHIKPIEKNWMPFERLEKGKPHLSFVYGIHPHKIIDVPQPETSQVTHFTYPGRINLATADWNKCWGAPFGGTTARLVDNEYLSFFHSWFKEDNKIWYVMGAYTFESTPPYAITAITPYPILFQNIYSSEYLNTADANKYCIFPAGVAVETKKDRTLLHVSCGENDSKIKIVTFDHKKLRESMVAPK